MPVEHLLTPGTKVRVTTRATDERTALAWIRETIERLHLGSWSCEFGLDRVGSTGSEVWVKGLVQEKMTPEEVAEFERLVPPRTVLHGAEDASPPPP
jgi:uncharacterized membrane protein YidH (DUF202 family)